MMLAVVYLRSLEASVLSALHHLRVGPFTKLRLLDLRAAPETARER